MDLADNIGYGNRFRENPPPGTKFSAEEKSGKPLLRPRPTFRGTTPSTVDPSRPAHAQEVVASR